MDSNGSPPTASTPAEWTEELEESGVPEVLRRLSKDIRTAARTLTTKEARFLVDVYYQWQHERIRQSNQIRALTVSGEPHDATAFVLGQSAVLERQVQAVLDAWSMSEPTEMGRWARGITGVGAIIAAGLVAHLDITQAATVGHWWRFAGLDPTVVWKSGEKRPWNASLKVICWKAGQSFMKNQHRETDVYGRHYRARKAYEQAKNEAGDYADQARAALANKRYGAETEARKWYEQGKLPPGHIDARARRWTVKLFLSHYHDVAYERHYGTPPPLPYPIAHLGHVDRIPPAEVTTKT